MTMTDRSSVQPQQPPLPATRSTMLLFQSMLCASSSSTNCSVIVDTNDDYYYADGITKPKDTSSSRNASCNIFRSLMKRRIGTTSLAAPSSNGGSKGTRGRCDEVFDNSQLNNGIHPSMAVLEQKHYSVILTKDKAGSDSDDELTADPADSCSSIFISSIGSTTSTTPVLIWTTKSKDETMPLSTIDSCEEKTSEEDDSSQSNAILSEAAYTANSSLTNAALAIALGKPANPRASSVSSIGTATTVTRTTTCSRSNSSLSWGTVEVRTYEEIMEDDPATPSGPPVCIGWNVLQDDSLRLDDYEQHRTEDSKRRKEELWKQREEQLGCTRAQMELEMIKMLRSASAQKIISKPPCDPFFQRFFRKMRF